MTKKPREPSDPTDTSHPLYDPTLDPTHRFYLGSKTEGEQKPDRPDPSAYRVGPGFPPNEYKWKKGGPSPYPKGRPKKEPSMKPDLKKALEAALNEKVVITKDRKEIVLTKAALGIQQLVNQYAKGDRHARRDLFQYAAQLGVDLHAKDLITEALGIDNQAIVDAAFLRYQQHHSPQAAPDDHVKAPPDLVDDDVTKPEPNETAAASPQADKSKMSPAEPVLDEHGRPLPVSDIRYVRAMRERNLAEQKKNQEGS
jgi:hypothetical protein